MNKLATVEKIHSIQPHPNEEVEKLEVAKILEWPVVIPKDKYKNGDLVIFIRIDSICPKENPYFAFLERQKYRIWNAKFKGAPSQGLVCPLSILPNFRVLGGNPTYYLFNGDGTAIQVGEGSDITDALSITKFEKPLDASIGGDCVGGFPTHLVPITDEDNLLNNPAVLEEFRGQQCYITTKADGSSMTVILENGKIRVCSRRLELKEGSGFWKVIERYELPKMLKLYDNAFHTNLAIQAEVCGGKIQGNPMGLADMSFFVFNIKEIATGKWYGWKDIKDVCYILKINSVIPIMEDFTFNMGIDELQAIANKASYTTASGEQRKGEGIVLRTMVPKFSPILGKMLSVKILNQDYK